MKSFVAYHGSAFTIEWYYNSECQSSALDYFLELSPERQDQVLKLFKLMGDRGRINNITKFRNEGEGIYAFKPQPDRFLCFFYKEKKIVITNAFEKKQDKLPNSEKQKALLLKKNYNSRVEEGIYYEK
jgi:mRNA-degrading endonuclease RelE of RelBE toxin-antitoxin system